LAELEPRIVDALRDVYDPCCQEKGISVVDMGLVRSASVTADGNARVELLLTSGWCPFAARVVGDVRERVENVTGLVGAEIEIVWDEPWTTDRLSPEATRKLRFLPDPVVVGDRDAYVAANMPPRRGPEDEEDRRDR